MFGKRNHIVLRLFLLSSCIIIILGGCRFGRRPDPTPIPITLPAQFANSAATPSGAFFSAQRGIVLEEEAFSGRVVFASQEDLFFRRSGRVAQIYVQDGELVQEGDVIAELDNHALQQDLETAQMSLAIATLAVEDAQRSLARQRLQAEMNLNIATLRLRDAEASSPNLQPSTLAVPALVITESAAITIPTNLEQPESTELVVLRYQQLLAQLALDDLASDIHPTVTLALRRAEIEVERAKQAILDGQIIASFAGQVRFTNLTSGDNQTPVDAYEAVARLVDPKQFRVELNLTRPQMLPLREQMAVQLRATSFGDKLIDGFISALPRPYGRGTGALVEIGISNPVDQLALVEGLDIGVNLTLQSDRGSLAIPRPALIERDQEYYVLVFDPEINRQREVKVIAGIIGLDLVEITVGLKEGDLVVVGNSAQIDAALAQIQRNVEIIRNATPTPMPTHTATATSPPTETATATPTATATFTPAPSNTATNTATPTPSSTATIIPTATASNTATLPPSPTTTPTASHTATLLPTATLTFTNTATPSRTPTTAPTTTPTASHTATLLPTATLTFTNTATPSRTPTTAPTTTPTASHTTTLLPTATLTFINTATPSRTPTTAPTTTPTASHTATLLPTATLTFINTATPSRTPTTAPTTTPTASRTATALPTATATRTNTATNTPLPSATPTVTHTATALPTITPFPINTVTNTPLPTATATLINTATKIPTATPSPTVTATALPTQTSTATLSPTVVPTASLTSTATESDSNSAGVAINSTETVPNLILFLGDADQDLLPEAYQMNEDGSALLKLTDPVVYFAAEACDRLSMTERYRATVAEDGNDNNRLQIYLIDSETLEQSQLTFHEQGDFVGFPVWSPTSDTIAYISNQSAANEIWIIQKAGWPATQLTQNSWQADDHPSWSPDGQQIVFSSNRTRSRQLWIMRANGENQRQLTSLPFEIWNPVWLKYELSTPLDN